MIKRMKKKTTLLLLATLPAVGFADLGSVVRVGTGGFPWMETDGSGAIHVVYDGKYRIGDSVDSLGAEELVVSVEQHEFMNPKIAVDASGKPHIVYQKGRTGEASSCYYTTREDGEWIEVEEFAVKEEIGPNAARTMLPDVCADEEGNVLACLWSTKNDNELQKAIYRWRSSDGAWSEYLGGLSGYHAASPKVEVSGGQFYLHYAKNDFDKMIAGPVSFGERFEESTLDFGSREINRSFQNEGTNFISGEGGLVVASGNFRKTSEGGGVGVWVSTNRSGSFEAKIIAAFAGKQPEGKGEGHQQPDMAIDRQTGDVYVVYFYDADKKAYYHVERDGEWTGAKRLYPEEEGKQGYFRNGPSVADVPGKGVVACFVNDGNVYMREIGR